MKRITAKIILISLTIIPYLLLTVCTSIGHILLCFWFLKRPKAGFWLDLIWFYRRFLTGYERLNAV